LDFLAHDIATKAGIGRFLQVPESAFRKRDGQCIDQGFRIPVDAGAAAPKHPPLAGQDVTADIRQRNGDMAT